MTEGDRPDISSDELIRRAREELGRPPVDDRAADDAPHPEPSASDDETFASRDDAGGATPDDTPTDPPTPPTTAIPVAPAGAPSAGASDLSPSGARTWFIVAGLLVAVVTVLVVLALASDDDAVSSIGAGVCFLDPGQGEISQLDILDCTEPHDFESIGRVTLPDGPYPGDLAAVQAAITRCLDLFEPYVGEPAAASRLFVDAFVPTPASWERGDRDAICIVFAADADLNPVRTSGSVRDTAG